MQYSNSISQREEGHAPENYHNIEIPSSQQVPYYAQNGLISFNKGVQGLTDNLFNTIPHNAHPKIELISITFQEGYKDAAGLTMYCNNAFLFNVGRFVSRSNGSTFTLPVNRYIVSNYENIELKANSRKPFKFILNYRYHK